LALQVVVVGEMASVVQQARLVVVVVEEAWAA
jgi:hypothetical protein